MSGDENNGLTGRMGRTIVLLITATDALYVLNTAVGVRACKACVCDTDGWVSARSASGVSAGWAT